MARNVRFGLGLVVAGILLGVSSAFFISCTAADCTGPDQGVRDLVLHLDTLAIGWKDDCNDCGVSLLPALAGLVNVVVGVGALADFER
ncbi:hypothetical protein [Haloarchaeobius iranensis]|uniref:Uncharacterized protein n=1 Tax=Haloarchaeobius iranensis TaxID=996166 RepID=A0A1G9UUL6_9EURY|nr:hypothetical protein [Haloarchaeobius iranensis]SDM63602.1 hypothetical protein SAMN05192554_10513 [Haloarchaeobius iranensis]